MSIENVLEEMLIEQKTTNQLLRSMLAAMRVDRAVLNIPSIDLDSLPFRKGREPIEENSET